MKVKSDNVTYSEYKYLQTELVLLPNISSHSDSIQINYYHDGFLPDFSLYILFKVPINEIQEIDGKHWFEKNRDTNYKWIEYKDGAN